MSKKVVLAGRADSHYGKVTAWMRKAQVYTKKQVVAQFKELGLNDAAAMASAVVLLSPRLVATRKGAKKDSCQGNLSNPWGHQAYNEKLQKVKGQEQKFRFKLRKTVLEPQTRNAKETKVATPQKTATKAEVKAEAKTDAPVTA